MHDRRDGVEEGERVLAGQLADRLGERGRGERPGGDDDAVPIRRRQPAISSRRISISGWAASAAVTAPSRSPRGRPRARRRPAPDWRRQARMISEPSRRISSCSRPTALCSRSSERNEFERGGGATRKRESARTRAGAFDSDGCAFQRLALSHATRGMSDRVIPISANSRSPSWVQLVQAGIVAPPGLQEVEDCDEHDHCLSYCPARKICRLSYPVR